MARELERVDLSEDLVEACTDLSLTLVFNLAHQKEMLVKLACSHASQGDCTISGEGHIHVQDCVCVDVDDLVHLIMELVKHCEREGTFRSVVILSSFRCRCIIDKAVTLFRLLRRLVLQIVVKVHLALTCLVTSPLIVMNHTTRVTSEQELVV